MLRGCLELSCLSLETCGLIGGATVFVERNCPVLYHTDALSQRHDIACQNATPRLPWASTGLRNYNCTGFAFALTGCDPLTLLILVEQLLKRAQERALPLVRRPTLPAVSSSMHPIRAVVRPFCVLWVGQTWQLKHGSGDMISNFV